MSLLAIAAVSLAGLAAIGVAWAVLSVLSSSAKGATGAYETEMSQTLESMFLFVPARRIVEIGMFAAGAVFLLVLLPFCRFDSFWIFPLGLVLATLCATVTFLSPRLVVRHLRIRRRERFNLQLLEALPMMSNALRAGFSINQAFESVADGTDGPMKQEVTLFLQQLRVGVPFTEALENFDHRVGSEDLTLVCTSIDIARKSGGNLTEVFDTIADTIRARMRIHQHVKTLTAQGRLQGLIIGAMPFLLCIGMTIFKPGLMLPFLCSLHGVITLLTVTFLVALGGWMIRRIVTIEV